uniref:Uncharacterized protein n=1 Tax=Panagrolaimus superbus TaxID=310955 RepID=A0A914Y6C5_9BILA
MKKLKKNIFTQEKLIFRDKKTLASESIQHSLKIAKYVQDRGYTKYHVIPTCAKKYRIHSCDAFTHPFLEIEVGEQLPYKFEDYVPRSCNAFCITGFDDNGENEKLIYETVQEENDRHRSKITVLVDPESFPLLLVKPVIIDLIQDLPARLDKSLTKKIPVIVFCDNFSVICACKKDETNYSYLADWNGMFGHDASILIDGEKREFGWEAKELKYNLHESGVFDMVSLMSKELEDITFQHRPALGKDPETKLCSLMTNLIEEHFGVIREATGSPVEEVAFWLLLTNDESKNSRFKERLVESFKPLGIVCHLLKLKVPQ